MIIVVAGEIDFPVERRDAALVEARPWIDAALIEPGCRHYAWSTDPHDPARVHVFEEWASAETLDAHLAGPAYRGMLAHLGSFTIVNAHTRKYRCDRVEPVYRADGVATARFDAR